MPCFLGTLCIGICAICRCCKHAIFMIRGLQSPGKMCRQWWQRPCSLPSLHPGPRRRKRLPAAWKECGWRRHILEDNSEVSREGTDGKFTSLNDLFKSSIPHLLYVSLDCGILEAKLVEAERITHLDVNGLSVQNADERQGCKKNWCPHDNEVRLKGGCYLFRIPRWPKPEVRYNIL